MRRIKMAYGDNPLKLVVVLRDPVERTLSQFRMDYYKHRYTFSSAEEVRVEAGVSHLIRRARVLRT